MKLLYNQETIKKKKIAFVRETIEEVSSQNTIHLMVTQVSCSTKISFEIYACMHKLNICYRNQWIVGREKYVYYYSYFYFGSILTESA